MATATRPGLQATELSFCLPPSGLGPLSPWVAVALGGGVSEGAGALGGCGTPCGLSSLWFHDQESLSRPRPATSRKQKEKAVPGASDLKQANKWGQRRNARNVAGPLPGTGPGPPPGSLRPPGAGRGGQRQSPRLRNSGSRPRPHPGLVARGVWGSGQGVPRGLNSPPWKVLETKASPET